MDTQQDRKAASQAAAALWWIVLIMGIVWFVIALVVLRIDETSVTTVGVIMGVVLVIGALAEIVAVALVDGAWRIWHAILSVLFVLAAIWAFTEPKQAFWALASVLGFMLLLVGVYEIARAFVTKSENEGWWLGLVVGILYIVLAFWVSQQLDPVKGQLLLFIIGIFALLRGISEIVLAFALRSAGKELAKS